MPISSRRCGMITKREAERLCKSFLGDNSPPKLPENFAFEVRLHNKVSVSSQNAFNEYANYPITLFFMFLISGISWMCMGMPRTICAIKIQLLESQMHQMLFLCRFLFPKQVCLPFPSFVDWYWQIHTARCRKFQFLAKAHKTPWRSTRGKYGCYFNSNYSFRNVLVR